MQRAAGTPSTCAMRAYRASVFAARRNPFAPPVWTTREPSGSGRRLPLPEGSRVVHTGGAKGLRRAANTEALYARIAHVLGVPAARCISEYGMTELASQFYDDPSGTLPRLKLGP